MLPLKLSSLAPSLYQTDKKFPVLTFLLKLRDFCSSSLLSGVSPLFYVAKSSGQVEFSDLYKIILGPLVGGLPMAAHTIKSEQ